MRIAIFIKNTIYHGSFGGLETQNENLVTGLKRAGHDVVVFVPKITPGRYNNAWWQQSLSEFKIRHQEKPFDVVVSQSAAGAEIIKNKKEFNIRTVVIAHGTIFGEVKTVWRRTRTLKDVYYLARSIAFGIKTYCFLDRDYLNGCDHIVAVSEAVKIALTREFGLADSKITVIPNGVDVNLYQVAAQNTPEVTFLYFGRIEREKGLEVLLKAFKDARDQVSNAKLKVVGSGPYTDNVVNLVKEFNLSTVVEILPRVDYQDIPKLLNSVNVFVLPSLRVEGLPMTLVESAAAGLPLLATDMGGNSAVVKDGVTGFLVKSGDVAELMVKMARMAKDVELRTRLGVASRKIAEEEFSREKMVKNYITVMDRFGAP